MVAAVRAETRWATRCIPIFLAAAVGYTTYVFSKRICVDYFLRHRQQTGLAIALLVLHFTFLCLMVATYFRAFLVIQYNPGVTPLGPLAVEREEREKEAQKNRTLCGRGRGREEDLEASPYDAYWPDPNVDSPGLERFYSKSVFICHTDGRPRWCSSCYNWKQDRASHCSEINRCVKKMDHYCPWVGGIVGETSFKFFLQFTFYTAVHCIAILTASAICLRSSIKDGALDGFVVGAVVLSAFFGLFTFAMTATSARYACVNLTNVDYIKSKTLVHQLAIQVPRGTAPGLDYSIITYPLPKPDSDRSTNRSPTPPATSEPMSERDLLATRTFAVVKTEKGENPWHLGWYRNWKSIMGNNIFDWVLPFNHSPCEDYENNESFYEMGPLIQELRRRYHLPEMPMNEKGGLELRELEQGRSGRGGVGGASNAAL